jgi:hypothetical protein
MTQEGKAISRSGSLHAPAVAVLVLVHHVAGAARFLLVGLPC